tara:strand:- start:1022 stop:1606 length:585 start_codon:yes stop_codon:yes gene_type:complete
MAITYPLSLPATNSVSEITLNAINAVAYSRSPFTFTGQAHAYAGEMWSADITLKAMRESDAEKWSAWLTALRGQFGTFLLGNPFRNSPRGTATAATITGSAGARSVTVAKTGTLLAGDYFQLGTTTQARLYKVLEDSDGSGTLEIWPALRASASGVAADLTSPVGAFRLSSNEASWSVNNLAVYGITFGAVEAI